MKDWRLISVSPCLRDCIHSDTLGGLESPGESIEMKSMKRKRNKATYKPFDAPATSIVMALLAPSASCCIWPARSAHAAVSSSVKSPGSADTCAAALASSRTASFVDMQPSVSSRSNVLRTAIRSAESRSAGGRGGGGAPPSSQGGAAGGG